MVALFHAKSRTCVNKFVKASQLNSSEGSTLLCEPNRFAAGRKAAAAYLDGCKRRHKDDLESQHKKIEKLLSRLDPKNRAALAVAEVSFATAMPVATLERAARGHIAEAESSVKGRRWSNAEEELRVIESLYAQVANTNMLPSTEVSTAVQHVRDMAAVARCLDLLSLAQAHCEQQLYGAAQVAILELNKTVRSLSSGLSAEGRAKLQKIAQEARDLCMTAELGADQAAMEGALNCLRQGDAAAARNQLRVLLAHVGARPQGHPSHEDRASILQAIRDCDDSQRVDMDYSTIARAQAAGELRQVFNRSLALQQVLKRTSPDLACRTPAGVLAGLRAWDAQGSKLLAFARLLEQSQVYPLANRHVVEGTIRALGILEGPAGVFSVTVGSTDLPTPKTMESYAYPSMKARIAAEAGRPGGQDAIVTLRMGNQRMYFHSGNYTEGLADIINTAPQMFSEFAAHALTHDQHALLFDALGFTCVEAQLSALQQALLDPLEEDMSDKHTPHARCDEHLRVFHLKQIRKYAADHGLNPDGHRDDIDAKADFMATYFNARTFRSYLDEKGFRASPQQMHELIRYEIDVVGILGE